MEKKTEFLTNVQLKTLSEEDLFKMLFHGSDERDIKQRQAAHELSRRNQAWVHRMQISFAALSVIAATASAVVAFLQLK